MTFTSCKHQFFNEQLPFSSSNNSFPMSNCRKTPKTRLPPSNMPSTCHLPSQSIEALPRLSSEPLLSVPPPASTAESGLLLPRRQTYKDIFASAVRSLPTSPSKHEEHGEDWKVVVSVTVEGSPGPVRTMVRLGATVEETIRLVVDRYRSEGRSPRIGSDGPTSSAAMFELHHSHFSLESLNRSDKIGEVGSRSFYLRRSQSGRSRGSIGDGDGDEDGKEGHERLNPAESILLQPHVFSSFIAKKMMSKIKRRTRKIWTLLGCMFCE